MEPKMMNEIFEAFVRGMRRGARAYMGTIVTVLVCVWPLRRLGWRRWSSAPSPETCWA